MARGGYLHNYFLLYEVINLSISCSVGTSNTAFFQDSLKFCGSRILLITSIGVHSLGVIPFDRR
ncbi:hypothetical protein [Vibrio phage vB_pir03]|nr:hypothetical protein [Vibrio phage vB_pir03]